MMHYFMILLLREKEHVLQIKNNFIKLGKFFNEERINDINDEGDDESDYP